MAEVIEQIVTLTDRAAAEIQRLRTSENIPDEQALRVGVKGGGCSGLSYILDFDSPTEKDSRYEVKGVDLVVDPRHALYLMGIEVDFEHGLNDRGFIFNNPNATNTCGCGTSFSTN